LALGLIVGRRGLNSSCFSITSTKEPFQLRNQGGRRPEGASRRHFHYQREGFNDILYSGGSTIRSYNPKTHVDTLVAGGFNGSADLALDPGGKTVLVSEFGTGKIFRVDLTTHSVTPFSSLAGGSTGANGITYDSSGHLFVANGPRFAGFPDSFVYQLDPKTGAILNKSAAVTGLDGLTFDPFSGKLYATSYEGSELYAVNPTTLAVTPLATIPGPDGIASNGKGTIWIASYSADRVYQYDINTTTLTPNAVIPGQLDDLAPLTGLGAAVPEPSTFALAGFGLLTALGYAWRRRKAAFMAIA
jgi:sugar lactone lactonase YvrE